MVAVNGMLQGLVNITLYLVDAPLPSRERSEEIARVFLEENAAGLLPRMEMS